MSRLLTPAQMEGLVEAVYKRDGGCAGRVWPDHVCGGFRHVRRYEAHHVCEQAAIKKMYGKLGGVLVAPHGTTRFEPFYRPVKPTGPRMDPDITAAEIAADPDLCICLCCNLHDQWPGLKVSEKLDLLDKQLLILDAAATKYSLRHLLEKEIGEWQWKQAIGNRL